MGIKHSSHKPILFSRRNLQLKSGLTDLKRLALIHHTFRRNAHQTNSIIQLCKPHSIKYLQLTCSFSLKVTSLPPQLSFLTNAPHATNIPTHPHLIPLLRSLLPIANILNMPTRLLTQLLPICRCARTFWHTQAIRVY